MITRVTITGADDSIQPGDLLELTYMFPFVEWGILISKTSMGHARFPSFEWLELLSYFKEHGAGEAVNLSAHLCGRAVREMLMGNQDIVKTLGPIWGIFDRVQINTHAVPHNYTERAFVDLATYSDKEFIFQYDGVNTAFLDLAWQYEVNHSALFDLSHGVGKLPSQRPDLLPNTRCGYAGGLSPENLQREIERIEEKAGAQAVLIDMETHVRSKDNKLFDLKKVQRCLEIASKYIQPVPQAL